MGLDWIVGHKPRPGHESEFQGIVSTLLRDKLGKVDRAAIPRRRWDGLARIFGKPGATPGASEDLKRRYDEIGIPAHATLNAPRVGSDPAADDWARTTHAAQGIAKPLDEWLAEMRGYYVLDLVPPCDGMPSYSNAAFGYVERSSFRAQFLKKTTAIIGDHLLEACYEVKFAPDLSAFGRALQVRANAYAKARGLGALEKPPEDPDSEEGRLDIVMSAARWSQFWGDRGHFLEPSF